MARESLLRCIILGGGGHARMVIDCLRASGAASPEAVLDEDAARWGQEVLGVPIIGGDERLPELARQGMTCFAVGVGGVEDNGPRRQLFERGRSHGLAALTIRHPSAVCSSTAIVGDGCLLAPAAIVNAGAVLGTNVIVNTGAIVEHDCVIGDHVHLATGATLCGQVAVAALAHIGAGATVKQGVSIGEGAVVGAGAVVIKDVAPWTVVGGVPAHLLQHALAGKH